MHATVGLKQTVTMTMTGTATVGGCGRMYQAREIRDMNLLIHKPEHNHMQIHVHLHVLLLD